MRFTILICLLAPAATLIAGEAPSPNPFASLNPQVEAIVSQVSAERIAALEKKLGSFGTRNIYSATDDSEHGIGAAREWIASQFRSYSPRLQVSFDKHKLAKQGRAFRDVEIWNVVAVLPGTGEPERQVLITGHYDTINMVFKPGPEDRPVLDPEATAAAPAPGVTDDGSGTAAVMELARLMSQYQFRKTLVFIAFAAEEYGLFGSGLYAENAARAHQVIEGVFNNDIIGSDITGNGETDNRYVNVYSEGPEDSASRELARYFKETAERYQPGFGVNLVFRHDRFGRGGDHSTFNAFGYAAVRVTTPMENFSNQHTATDTFANTDPQYATLVAKANAAAAASLALAPKAPELPSSEPAPGHLFAEPLSRGKSADGHAGYDAVMSWQNPHPEPDLLGYAVVIRSTTSPLWQREIFVGDVLSHTLPNVNIDEVVLGVKAIDKTGNESLISPYVTRPYHQPKIATY
ncbi:MAG: M28 family peptidase [Acidobacteriaceae bacterium]|nr:M28 family peptidase [Acidobacteriaceae bacterium]MBV8572074.1 M28 family peptidase [Acidobacteriaceae bacterium]